ncbi:MAG: tetratricopeptide repeat protein [Thermodesulfobacteriota bacterium]
MAKIILRLLIFSALCACSGLQTHRAVSPPPKADRTSFFATGPDKPLLRPKPLPVNRPVQETFEADPVRYATLSGDGRWMAYVSENEGVSKVTLRPVNPSHGPPPRTLTHLHGRITSLALSHHGRWLAFEGRAYDVKGDIYLLDLKENNNRPIRLTDRTTGDGAPVFAPDGKVLYFHQSPRGRPQKRLMGINLPASLSSPTSPGKDIPGPHAIETEGDGAFPVISPDGTQVAFVSLREDPGGDIFVLNLKTGALRQMTRGPARDRHPCWSREGDRIYFSRLPPLAGSGENRHRAETVSLYRIPVKVHRPLSYPLTSDTDDAYQPMATESGLYFLSNQKGITNIWSLPLEGRIPRRSTAAEQMRLAENLASRISPDHGITLLAYYKVMEAFPDNETLQGKAAFSIGRLYEEQNRPHDAVRAYTRAMKSADPSIASPALAEIRLQATRAREEFKKAVTAQEKNRAIDKGLADLDRIIARLEEKYPRLSGPQRLRVRTRAIMEQAKLIALMNNPESILKAINLLDRVLKTADGHEPQMAEAMVLKAELYERMGKADSALSTYVRVIERFPGAETWSDRAVDRILDIKVPGTTGEQQEDKIQLLTGMTKEYEKQLPRLAMAALNRTADLYFSSDRWQQAKSAYREVITRFPIMNTQSAAARLALAEILYREERFRQALDLYETEMGARTYEDSLYGLIRDAYIKKSLDAADFQYRLGEVPSARNDYINLIREDYSLVRAHRGYIKCAAARKQIPKVLARYRNQLKQTPDHPVSLYATGLCLTYVPGMDALKEARSLVTKAIEQDGQVAYFHQTLGYTDEVLETVHGKSGGLEKALESYQRAYFLNNPHKDPKNSADLALNLGNIYFLLGNFSKAYAYYTERLESDFPFDQARTEILFYRRLGAAAFQLRNPVKTIAAYKKALNLIQARIDPKHASEILGKINSRIFGTIITPALKKPGIAERARAVGEKQAAINQDLFEATGRSVGQLPDPAWPKYKEAMETIIERQQELLEQLPPLLAQTGKEEDETQPIETLAYMITRAEDALNQPESLLQLRAEMLDRLALAYQEEGNWKEARKQFTRAYSLNEGLGLVKNLAASQRSLAYSAYMEAGQCTGDEKRHMLQTALKEFTSVLHLVDQYGVKDNKNGQDEKSPSKGKGSLMSISLDIALDKTTATQATYGFTADQEKRLARTYISRIAVELGKLGPAETDMEAVLSVYASQPVIPEADIYGTSLLYHRAGHLAYALHDPVNAFHRFKTSAELSLRLDNPVSSALNVTNLAHALARMSKEDRATGPFLPGLRVLDRRTIRLLNTRVDVLKPDVIPAYHNTMGVLYLKTPPEIADPAVFSAIGEMEALRAAGKHFSRGLKYLKTKEPVPSRKLLKILTALHLNMAQVASELDDPEEAARQLDEALRTARQAMLPEYEWRALAQKGRLDDALAVLTSVPILRAGCGPQEITRCFRPLVFRLINEDQPEKAFNLMERISEIERVHRLSPLLLGHIAKSEQDLLVRIYPRLIRIQHLKTGLKDAGDAKAHLKNRLQEEQRLLNIELGNGREKMPSIARLSTSESLQDRIMILLGAAFLTEKAADKCVGKATEAQFPELKARYQERAKAYTSALAELKKASSTEGEREIGALFAPDPAQAVDIMENLPKHATLIRLAGPDETKDSWHSLSVTPEAITPAPWGRQNSIEPGKGLHIIAWEDLEALPSHITSPAALSATHLFRCIRNKKPFKRQVFSLAYQDPLPQPFVQESIPLSSAQTDLFQALEGVNSLIVNTPVHRTASVPTRPGETPVPFMALKMDRGRSLPLVELKDKASNVSLAIFPKGSMADVYPLAHFFSLLQVPTLLLTRDPGEGASFVEPFFRAYGDASALDAFSAVKSGRIRPAQEKGAKGSATRDWLQIGYWGLTPDQARVFAKNQFTRYVKDGIGSFQKGKPGKALADFENALMVAREDTELNQYVPKLHTYARESAFSSGQFEKARSHAKALVALLAEQNPDSEAYAAALLKLGLVDARLETYERAVPNLEKGIEIMANLELGEARVSALTDLGLVLENATDYQKALDQFESAASLIGSLNKPQLMARQYMRMGRIYDLRLSRYARAKISYKRAYDIYETLGQKENMAQALLDMGRSCRLLGNFQEAEHNYQAALRFIEKGENNLRLKANVHMEQANNAWFQARYQEAFELQDKVHRLAEQNDWPLEQVMALNTSGLIWWTLGDHERALRELKKALDLAETLRIRKDEKATTLNNMGLVYRHMGDFQQALDVLDQALDIDRSLNSRWAMAYDLKNQAMTYLMMKDPEKALPLFKDALKMARDIGNQINVAKILLGYGQALEQHREEGKAETIYRKALTLSRSMHLQETQWRALFGLGRLSLSLGNRQEARDFLTRAMEVIEGVRSEIRLDQLKDGFMRGKMSVYETLVSLLVEMGKPREAFNIAERSRARNLIDLLGNQRLTLKGAVDQALYDQQKQLKSRIREYEALLVQAENEAEQKTYEKGFNRASDQYRDLMLRIQAEHPELATLVSVNPLTLRKIQDLIEPGVALLAFYVVPDQVFCWVITPESVRLLVTPLGRETLREAILDYRRMLQNLEPTEKLSKTLYSWVLSRVRPQLESVNTLGIVPHDALHHLSLATLYDGKNHMADRFALFYLPSASVLKYTRQRRSPEKSVNVLAIGNPDLKNPALELPFAEHEVASIGWNFPQITVLTGDKATESWVVRHMGDFGVVHMASHGEFDPINPLFSAIKLAKAPQDDGELEAAEIFGLRLRADLVMLSACQTGLGKVTAGDDVIGLNRAFLYAGTHAIISSLWRVSDISTAMLVKQFYRDYTSKNKADSLKHAISHVKNRYPHPGYWGAFVLVGDYQ